MEFRFTPEQISAELAQAGFTLRTTYDFLPQQIFLVYGRSETTTTPPDFRQRRDRRVAQCGPDQGPKENLLRSPLAPDLWHVAIAMTRILSLIVTLALIAGAIAPVAAHEPVRQGAAGTSAR